MGMGILFHLGRTFSQSQSYQLKFGYMHARYRQFKSQAFGWHGDVIRRQAYRLGPKL